MDAETHNISSEEKKEEKFSINGDFCCGSDCM